MSAGPSRASVVILLFPLLAAGNQTLAAPPDPLFATDTVLRMTITAPIARIMNTRPEALDVPGILRIGDDGPDQPVLDIGIRTRGESRRDPRVCPFAPLRLNFQASRVAGTVFANQDKIKLVTHCRDRSRHYEQAVLTEYLAYRMLNLLTDKSFRVRLVVLTYVDTETGRRLVKPAFFVETEDRLGERIGLPQVKTDAVDVGVLAPAHTSLVSVFQFLIGNTDFSPVASLEGEPCCHNTVPFGRSGEAWYSIPYDFDQSGIVNARHAAPDPHFGLRSVRERLYRGRCEHNAYLPGTLERLLRHREEIDRLVDAQYGLSADTRRNTKRFIDAFYRLIDDPERRRTALDGQCL